MGVPSIPKISGFSERSRKLMESVQRQVLVFDGAMGTSIHAMDLSPEDFGGIPDCPEMLVLSKPSALASIHRSFFEAGADIVETDSFGGSTITLAEFGLEKRAEEINIRAAEIAREVAAEFTDKPRYVSGSIGPGTKLPSLGHVTVDELTASLYVQALGLIKGGVDLIQIETCQDILQIKSALIACTDAFHKLGIAVPVLLQMTVETTGTMLLGTEVTAAFATFECYPEVWGFGINCATGPTLMAPHLKTLTSLTDRAVVCLPNAGLPANVDGEVVYPLKPQPFADEVSGFVRDMGLNIVGGCCGTTPAHIKALAEAVSELPAKPREGDYTPSVASLYSNYHLRQEPPPLLVGERLNANGSRKFKKLLLKEDYDGMLAMAKSQMKGGAHLLDVCVAYVGRDEVRDMTELLNRLRAQSQLPLCIDSTQTDVIEQALKMVPGRALVNSINLEDGEERARTVLGLCRRYGASVIALTIDEEGQAYSAERKIAIAKRIYNLAIECGLRPHDIVFDCLTFTLGTGEERYRKVGVDTLEGIKGIKRECPGAYTILGLSNCSFGLNPAARQVLNSVFLNEAVKAGLDQAIVHASKILPLFKIPENEQELARQLIFDDRSEGDPLMDFISLFEDRKAKKSLRTERSDKIEKVLEYRIIDGDKKDLEKDLDEALKTYKPFEIINQFLLDGMKVVGELFGAGKMQLPFVLQSAEVMKSAVKYLENFMERVEGSNRGVVVLATVKGDVHDIGKNLVDIILSNNGFKVVNLGIKQPIETILAAAEEHNADIVGMSGLLVKSTVIMRDNLIEMNRRQLGHHKVLLGGAALTRGYVEGDLRSLYSGEVAYAQDAFDGLRLVTKVTEGDGSLVDAATAVATAPAKVAVAVIEAPEPSGRRSRTPVREPVVPPFWGAKKIEEPFSGRTEEIFEWINKRALYRGQWQFRRGGKSAKEAAAFERETVDPIFEELKAEALKIDLLTPKVAYGYFPCRADGEDLVIYTDETGAEERMRLPFPRQTVGKKDLCLTDYFHPEKIDCVAFSAVTVGEQSSRFTKELFDGDEYQRYLYFHGLSVEAAEGLAEYWHARIRQELGIDGDDASDRRKLFQQNYQGARYSFGYPACPDLHLQKQIFELIPAAEIGLTLTEECQLVPEQSTTALVVTHPEARYFSC